MDTFPATQPEPAKERSRRRGRRPAARMALFVAVGVLAAIAATSAASAVDFGDPKHGQAVFESHRCVRCHAARGAGGMVGPDLGRTDLGSSYFGIVTKMWNHSPTMILEMKEYRIPHPRFEVTDLEDLISFLFFLRYFDEPGEPDVGRLLFSSLGCSTCHRVGDLGGLAGPRLDEFPRDTSPLRIAQELWNHAPLMVAELRRGSAPLPALEGHESLDLFAFLRSRGPRERTRDYRGPGDADVGQTLFQTKGCLDCHAILGDGGSLARDLGRTPLSGSATLTAMRMLNHWEVMTAAMRAVGAPYPKFEGRELADLLAYIFSVQYDSDEGDAEHGATLFVAQRCAFCHGPEGQGDVGPALREFTPGLPATTIVQLMWNHIPEMRAKGIELDVPWPRLSASDMADVVALLSAGWPGDPRPEAGGTASNPDVDTHENQPEHHEEDPK